MKGLQLSEGSKSSPSVTDPLSYVLDPHPRSTVSHFQGHLGRQKVFPVTGLDAETWKTSGPGGQGEDSHRCPAPGRAWQEPSPGGGRGGIPSIGLLSPLSAAQRGFVVPLGFWMFVKQAASCLPATWVRLCGKSALHSRPVSLLVGYPERFPELAPWSLLANEEETGGFTQPRLFEVLTVPLRLPFSCPLLAVPLSGPAFWHPDLRSLAALGTGLAQWGQPPPFQGILSLWVFGKAQKSEK